MTMRPPAASLLPLLVGLSLACLACGAAPAPTAKPDAHASAPAPAAAPSHASESPRFEAFRADRAWQNLVDLCNMGPRGHGLPGHQKAIDYIHARLASLGLSWRDVTCQYQASIDKAPSTFTSIVVTTGPKDGPWLIVGSHYDTRLWADEDPVASRHSSPIIGANDGGSGTAVLLEMATVLAAQPPPHGVTLIFFDGEDYGSRNTDDYFVSSRDMGRRFGEIFPGPRPSCAVIFDMVGDASLQFLREGTCQATHPWLNDALWRAGNLVRPDAFAPSGTLPVTDDHTALLQIGIPATLLIDFTYPPWHTLTDTLDKCSADSLATTGRVLLRALADSPPPTGR